MEELIKKIEKQLAAIDAKLELIVDALSQEVSAQDVEDMYNGTYGEPTEEAGE